MNEINNPRSKKNYIVFLPLLLLIVLSIFFAKQLLYGRPNNVIPSVMVSRKAPELELKGIPNFAQIPGIERDTLLNKVSVVNIFASWCGPCREEHAQLMNISQIEGIQVVGINYKDKPAEAAAFLGRLGNPFDVIGSDDTGRAAIEWGAYGLPETYFVSKNGIIRSKYTGPISENVLNEKVRPFLSKLLSE